MGNFHYSYTLQSDSSPDQIYTGQTHNLAQRLPVRFQAGVF